MKHIATALFCSLALVLPACSSEDQMDVKSQPGRAGETQASGEPNTDGETKQGDTDDRIDDGSDDGPEPEDPKPVPRTACTTTWQKPARNLKVEDIVGLINTLPKPVSIACLLDVLPRPFSVNATNSDLSVQPADGLTSPRIFVSIDFLILTFTLADGVVPSVEFSQIIADDRSVKGELAFPIKEDIAADEPYRQILRAGASGTRCAGCHFNEQPAPSSFPEGAYASRALRPFERQDASLSVLRALKNACAGKINDRCDILNALFSGEPPRQYLFPKAMPTLF